MNEKSTMIGLIQLLQVGDEILEINGGNAEIMSHAEAVNTIRNCAETARLLIRRPLQPIVSGKNRYLNEQQLGRNDFKLKH